MWNLIEWMKDNIYHTTLCDKHRRTLGNPCICGKATAIHDVESLLRQKQKAVQVLKHVVDFCRDYPCESASLQILALLKQWSTPKEQTK